MELFSKEQGQQERVLGFLKEVHIYSKEYKQIKVHSSVHVRNIQCATNTTTALKEVSWGLKPHIGFFA